jgi:hypothetical protein
LDQQNAIRYEFIMKFWLALSFSNWERR